MNTGFSTRRCLMGLVIFSLAASAIFFVLWLKGRESEEFLVVWGQKDEDCVLLLVNPRTRQTSHLVDSEANECNYQIVAMGGTERVILARNKAGEITLYSVSRSGHISLRRKVSIGQVEITSPLQWGYGGLFYFSGIMNEKERVFGLNAGTGAVTEITSLQTGMAYAPAVSPDGVWLAYLVYEGAPNRHDIRCIDGCPGHYYVMNLVEGGKPQRVLPLVENSDPEHPLPHCELKWSPRSQFFAFRSGCAPVDQSQILIVDPGRWQVVATIHPASPLLPYMSLHGWITDVSLVYETPTAILPDKYPIDRYYAYQVDRSEARELAEFPPLVTAETVFDISGIDWTKDGRLIAGSVIVGVGELPRIIIADIQEDDQIIYTRLRGDEPAWSPSGYWIAYKSGQNTALADSMGNGSYVVMQEALTNSHFGWLDLSR